VARLALDAFWLCVTCALVLGRETLMAGISHPFQILLYTVLGLGVVFLLGELTVVMVRLIDPRPYLEVGSNGLGVVQLLRRRHVDWSEVQYVDGIVTPAPSPDWLPDTIERFVRYVRGGSFKVKTERVLPVVVRDAETMADLRSVRRLVLDGWNDSGFGRGAV